LHGYCDLIILFCQVEGQFIFNFFFQNDHLLSSTPLEMDDDIFSKLLHKNDDRFNNNSENDGLHLSFNKKISPTSFNSNDNCAIDGGGGGSVGVESASHHEFEIYDQKLKEYELKLYELESHLNVTKDENKQLNEIKDENKYLLDEIRNLNKKIDDIEHNNEKKSENLEMIKNNSNNLESIYEKNENLEGLLDEYRNKYSIMEIGYMKVVEELSQNRNENGNILLVQSLIHKVILSF
jgi:DNA repair exonuclease SbcCD ATPase subunit